MPNRRARVTALENTCIEPATESGVIVMRSGETAEEALARVGPRKGGGGYLVVPGIMQNAEEWSAMCQRRPHGQKNGEG